ncbi:MAG: DUF3727 domain-containing protein [Cyanobacteria bacterium SID2]|nr:DUF3727 domain-containing protein [Cyanobacteria bacterium SID2]
MTQLTNGKGRFPATIVTVHDSAGRSLPCYIEHQFEVHGGNYAVLLPVNIPVDIVAWYGDDEEEAVLVLEEEIDEIFDTAKAVLAEHDLLLQRTALTLTVVGEIPELEDLEDELEDESEDDDPDAEELLLLANFYHEEQEYSVYVPLDPMLVLAKLNEAAQPELLSQEEFDRRTPV